MRDVLEEEKMEYDLKKDSTVEQDVESQLDAKTHEALLNYLLRRLEQGDQKRILRISRFARIDQSISTWQMMSPEDTKRESREEVTGRSQAIPMNLPVADAFIDDTVAFFTEIFAPLGGNFYSNPGTKSKSSAVMTLTKKLNQDTKINRYYMQVTTAMRTLCKYNVGGFHVGWTTGNKHDEHEGNKIESLDMYNFIYDPSIEDVNELHKNGEFSAMARVRNRLWLVRQAESRPLMHLEEILGDSNRSNSYEFGQAKFYRHPPRQTRIGTDGADGKSTNGEVGVDWDAYGLGSNESVTQIDGHEIVLMYCWINERQFGLDREDSESNICLYRFTICDGRWIIDMERLPDAIELPTYIARLKEDELKEAQRSIGEYLKPFQRLGSFLVNTHIEALRSSIWGLKAIDPQMFDTVGIKAGETSGLLVSKQPGRDVRSGLHAIQNNLESRQNLQDVGAVFDLMRMFFPSQAMPAQVAGMDRAVNSQVQAVMHGSMRKTHMFVRNIDSALMLPVRMASYRNIALFDPEKSKFGDVTPEEVAELLNSGLGQINREAAAEQVRTIIFGLIQNPEGAQGIDMKGLWTLYSLLLNIGTDLGEFMLQPTLSDPNNPQAGGAGAIDPATGQPIPAEAVSQAPPGMM